MSLDWRNRLALGFVALWQLAVLAAASMNLSGNNFLVKASNYWDRTVFVGDGFLNFIAYGMLLIPLWVWILYRHGLAELAESRGLGALVRGRRATFFWAAAFGLSLLFAYPASQVNLAEPMAARTVRTFIKLTIGFGVTRPAAAVLLFASLALLFGAGRNSSRAATGFALSTRGLAIGIALLFAAALLIRQFLMGPTFPKLEDELAYFMQSLLFEQGRLRGELIPPPGLSLEELGETLHLPYILRDGPYYYSAHIHGWSWLLTLFGLVGLRSIANLALSAASAALFWQCARSFFPENDGRGFGGTYPRQFAFALFVGAPIFLFLSTSYMAHTAALAALLLLLLAWRRLAPGAHAESSLDSEEHRFADALRWKWAPLVLLGAVCAVFIRPQSAIPTIAALAVFDTLLVAAVLMQPAVRRPLSALPEAQSGQAGADSLRPDSRHALRLRAAVARLFVIAAAAALAYALLLQYAALFPAAGVFFTDDYLSRFAGEGCQSIGFGPGHGCFPTYGTVGHSARKMLLICIELWAAANSELSAWGLPLLALALAAAPLIRKGLRPGGAELCFALIFGANFLLFGLYWHNGGESYRGRYLLDASFALALFCGAVLRAVPFAAAPGSSGSIAQADADAKPGRENRDAGALRKALLVCLAIGLGLSLFLTARGEFFSPSFPPFRSAATLPHPGEGPVENAVLSPAKPRTELLPEIRNGQVYFPDEFRPGELRGIPDTSLRAFVNFGYVTLACTLRSVDERGFFRDARGNYLLGPAPDDRLQEFARAVNASRALRLRFLPPEIPPRADGWKIWTPARRELQPLDAGPRTQSMPARDHQ